MEPKPLHTTTKVRIVCPSRPKDPYIDVIGELEIRSGADVDFVDKLHKLTNPIILDQKGEHLTQEKLNALLQNDVTFVVGGPDGFPEGFPPGPRFSLGDYTLNHHIAIIVLLDLIFRARNPNHPYNFH